MRLGSTRYANGYFDEADWGDAPKKYPYLPVLIFIVVFILLAIAVR